MCPVQTETIEVTVIEKQYPPSTFTKTCELPEAPVPLDADGITNEQFALSMIEHRLSIKECNVNLIKLEEWTTDGD